jgi:truncated hemoglobin YjbI
VFEVVRKRWTGVVEELPNSVGAELLADEVKSAQRHRAHHSKSTYTLGEKKQWMTIIR